MPGLSSIAGLLQQPVLVSSQLDWGSEPQSPPEGLAKNSMQSQRWDSNPLTPLYKSGTRPVEHRRLSFRVAGGSRTHNVLAHNQFPDPPGFGHSASIWIRTRNTAFGGPDDLRFTIEASLQYPDQELNLDLLFRKEP